MKNRKHIPQRTTLICAAVSSIPGVIRVLAFVRAVGSPFRADSAPSGFDVGAWDRSWGLSSVCEVVSLVLGLLWVPKATRTLASSKKTALRRSLYAWAAIDRQSPAPCSSVSHFRRSSSFPPCIPSSCPSGRPFLRAVSSFSWPSFFPAVYPSSQPSAHFLLPSSYPSS